MGWFSLATAVFSFAQELLKYLNERDEDNKKCADKVRGITNEIKSAIGSKDTSDVESMFRSINFSDDIDRPS